MILGLFERDSNSGSMSENSIKNAQETANMVAFCVLPGDKRLDIPPEFIHPR